MVLAAGRPDAARRARRALLLITPAALPLIMVPVFRVLPALLGARPGYFAGFVVWWACCAALALACGTLPLGARPATLKGPVVPLLLVLPLAALAFMFPRVLPQATLAVVLASAALAVVNATCEELLWRGAYAAAFPRDRLLGAVWPAIGFGVWHFAPQQVFASHTPGATGSFVAFAVVLGLCFGEAALRLRTLWPLVAAHALLDFSGLGARLYLS